MHALYAKCEQNDTKTLNATCICLLYNILISISEVGHTKQAFACRGNKTLIIKLWEETFRNIILGKEETELIGLVADSIELVPGGRIFPENNGEKSVKSVKIKKLPPYFSA